MTYLAPIFWDLHSLGVGLKISSNKPTMPHRFSNFTSFVILQEGMSASFLQVWVMPFHPITYLFFARCWFWCSKGMIVDNKFSSTIRGRQMEDSDIHSYLRRTRSKGYYKCRHSKEPHSYIFSSSQISCLITELKNFTATCRVTSCLGKNRSDFIR